MLQPSRPAIKILENPCKVLVVDDNEDNRALLTNYLQPLGLTVEEAENGRAELAIAETFQPDVILADLLMSVMDGVTMIRHLREHPQLKDTVAIVVSANVAPIMDSSDVPWDDFVTKPIDLEQFGQLLEQHLQLCWSSSDEQTASQEVELDRAIAPSTGNLIRAC